jgi:hypothetical protein
MRRSMESESSSGASTPNVVEALIHEVKAKRVLRKRTSRKTKLLDMHKFVEVVGGTATVYGTRGGYY